MANVIYGSEIAKQVKEDLRLRIMKLKNEQKRLPKLVVDFGRRTSCQCILCERERESLS